MVCHLLINLFSCLFIFILHGPCADDPPKGKRGKLAFNFEKCCFCFIGKLIPEHCTTILKTTFEKISLRPWKSQISFKIPKIIVKLMLVSLSFVRRLSNGGQVAH